MFTDILDFFGNLFAAAPVPCVETVPSTPKPNLWTSMKRRWRNETLTQPTIVTKKPDDGGFGGLFIVLFIFLAIGWLADKAATPFKSSKQEA